MNESLRDQLARLREARDLPRAVDSAKGEPADLHANKQKPALTNPQLTPYEDLILELEQLKDERNSLQGKLSQMEEAKDSELDCIKADLQTSQADLSAEKGRSQDLATELQALRKMLADRPTLEEARDLRAKILEADRRNAEAAKSNLDISLERARLAEDRAAFESDLDRLALLDEDIAKLKALEQAHQESVASVGQKSIELSKQEAALAVEKNKLDRQSEALQKIQSKIGHYRSIEKDFASLRDEYAKVSRLYLAGKTRVRNLTLQKEELEADLDVIKDKSNLTERELDQARRKLATWPEGELVVQSFETVQWLTSQFDASAEDVAPSRVLLIGDGPWPMDQFTERLQHLGFEVWQNGSNADIETVIVGRKNWETAVIENQIAERDGDTLRVYSQELFITLLAMRADPLEIAPEDDLRKFVAGHPVFEYLLNQQFPWPESTYEDAPPGNWHPITGLEDASSPLYKLGYSVAQSSGLSPTKRYQLLEQGLREPTLPWCISDDYMADWGEAQSRTRLRRIAWHLHLMSRRFKRHEDAVARWENDLNWLERTFYRSIYRFRWPG